MIASSFWDIHTTGQGESAGGTGKTTTEMKTISTFTDAGWDFLGESDNGTVDLWRMCLDGVDYPRLRWEFSQMGDLVCPDGVGLADLAYLCQRWLWDDCEALNHCDWADINRDGTVNLMDFSVLSEHWLEGIAGPEQDYSGTYECDIPGFVGYIYIEQEGAYADVYLNYDGPYAGVVEGNIMNITLDDENNVGTMVFFFSDCGQTFTGAGNLKGIGTASFNGWRVDD